MGRLKDLRTYVDAELEALPSEKRGSAVVHLYGVSLAATMIARRRGLDAELLSMAAMLHDLYAYKSGSYDDHAHKGADIPFDRKRFSPHITLLRKASFDRLPGVTVPKASMTAEKVSLMRSERGKNGMIYTEIGRIEA